MMVLPAVDIMKGKVVQLVGGVPGTERVVLPDPLQMAKRWQEAGAPGLHLIDLDAALGVGSNLDVIEEICSRLEIPVQVGGGIRSSQLVDRLLGSGADAVIVGTKAIADQGWLEEISLSYPWKVILALDVKKGEVQVKGWQESSGIALAEIFKRIAGLPLRAVLYTNVDVEGREEGVSIEAVSEFVERCPLPVIASGGVSSMMDIQALDSLNIKAVVVGVALYTGGIRPEQLWGKDP
jgi:phosphoribosylformimino-5-aminoimidazole carboxamide ribotide isomerase